MVRPKRFLTLIGRVFSVFQKIFRFFFNPVFFLAAILLMVFADKVPDFPHDDSVGEVLFFYLVVGFVFRFYRKLSSLKNKRKKVTFSVLLIALMAMAYFYSDGRIGWSNFFFMVVTAFLALLVAYVLLLLRQTPRFLRLLGHSLIWPFKSKRNFKRFLVGCIVFLYLFSIEYRFYRLFGDSGGYGKFFCSETLTKLRMKNSVVRIIGSEGQGSGFFLSPGEVITNFHVVDSEMSPKVILANGRFLKPEKIKAYKDFDLAVIYVKEEHPELVLDIAAASELSENQSLIAIGFPLGTDIKGEPTILKGKFLSFRQLKYQAAEYIQTNIALVQGMSGGPAVDACGKVVGINTLAVSGMSFLVRLNHIDSNFWNNFTDTEQTKIQLDPSKSPEEAVRTFYTYLKARRMDDGFGLLSNEYKQKTNMDEWTNRFPDVIDVYVYKTEMVPRSKDTVFIKFVTRNWVNKDDTVHYYEGTWQTVKEEGKYKLLKSKIKEIVDPLPAWFYE